MTSRASLTRWSWPDYVLVVLAMLLATVLRVRHFDTPPSFDELWHLRLSAAQDVPLGMYVPDQLYLDPRDPTSLASAPPFWRVWTGMDGVLHPPLYAITLRLWRDFFGNGNEVARAYSLAWALVAMAFTYAVARLAMGRGIAFTILIAVALSPVQLYFGQELRAYAMLTGLSSIAVWLMTRIELIGPSRRRAVALALLTLPMLLTHYFAFGAAIGIAVYGFWRLESHRRIFAISLISAAIVYGIIWIPFALDQIDDIGSGDISWKTEHRKFANELLLLATGPFRLIVDRGFDEERGSLAGASLFVLPWLLIRRQRALLPWAVLLACSLGAIVLLDLVRSTDVVLVTRYLSIASPTVFLLFAGCGWAVHKRLGFLMASGLAVMGAIYTYAGVSIALDTQTFAPVAREIARQGRPGEAVAAFGGLQSPFYGDAVLIACANAPNLAKRPFINLVKPMDAQTMAKLSPRIWLAVSASDPQPDFIVPGSRVLSRTMIELNLYLYYVELPSTAGAATTPTGG